MGDGWERDKHGWERDKHSERFQAWENGDPAATATQDQTRAEVIESIREAQSFIVATAVITDLGDRNEAHVSSLSSIMGDDMEIRFQLIVSGMESVATAWLSHSESALNLLGLISCFTEVAVKVHSELYGEGSGFPLEDEE